MIEVGMTLIVNAVSKPVSEEEAVLGVVASVTTQVLELEGEVNETIEETAIRIEAEHHRLAIESRSWFLLKVDS